MKDYQWESKYMFYNFLFSFFSCPHITCEMFVTNHFNSLAYILFFCLLPLYFSFSVISILYHRIPKNELFGVGKGKWR